MPIKKITVPSMLALSLAMSTQANAEAFSLGEVTVTAARPQIGEVGENQVSSVVTQKEIQQFNRNTVGEAVNLLSGVTVSTNARNEQMVYMRGYDPRQVPLFIDGIPVYVPYDGYVDFSRFGTADLAAIQVAKGFSSVAYGPNTLGGAINLVSRKPKSKFEGDASAGFGAENMRRAEANVGTNQGTWYLQAGAALREADGFRLSDNFTPTTREDGGRRDNSYYKDDKISLKFGLTPGGSDEYALTYINQSGEKGNPTPTDPTSQQRYWKWPHWDKESLYFISRTGLGEHEMLKLRLYLDKFDNEVNSYTNNTYTTLKTSAGGGIAFVGTGRSIYADNTVGGSFELESHRFAGHLLRLIAHNKSDKHEETDANNTLLADMRDTLRSLSIEDSISIGEMTQLSVGFAHHELHPDKVYNASSAYTLPGKQTANDPQIGLFHDLNQTTRLYATVAQKTRLPSLKDRYSARLGNFIANPDLQPETAVNYELGWQGTPWDGAQAEAALFWNDIDNMIQEVFIVAGSTSCNQAPGPRCQMQNIGKARMKGIELGLKTPLGTQWEVGGNATFMDLKNVSDPTVPLRGIPETKLTLHALWRPVATVDLTAFAEHDGYRWAFVKIPGYTTLNLKAAWRPTKDLAVELGVNNATDEDYELNTGFPAAGRMWFANASMKF